MPNLPVRNLGGAGVISDVHPYDLPPNAISAGVNIRFENGKVTRGPVPYRVFEYGTGFTPGYLFSIPPVASGGSTEALVTVSSNYGSIKQLIGATETDITPSGWSSSGTPDQAFTSTFLGNVVYLNRPSAVPLKLTNSDTDFGTLPGWNSGWRCASLRPYKDFLIALNVTKSGTEYPTMVKWSDVAAFGGPPSSWDETSTTNSAGENILNEMRESIVDGHSLRDSFIIYGESEVWLMDYIGGNFLFRFRKLFDAAGVINQNCVVQVDGLHYVFDRNDIWMHDGASKKSLIHGRDKDFVFHGLKEDLRHLCFTTHNPRLNEIYFCYPADDRLVGFRNPSTGCNRAAVYNYRLDLWSFIDLPNVNSACFSSLSTGESYTSIGTLTFEAIGGTYLGEDDPQKRHLLFSSAADAGLGLTKDRIYGLDLMFGGLLAKPIETEALKDAFVERVGIDLDELGVPLAAYKCVQAVFPQMGVTGNTGVYFQFGASDIVGVDPEWGVEQLFHPALDDKVDSREAGRYLAYRVRCSGLNDFSLSGFDALVTARGRRGAPIQPAILVPYVAPDTPIEVPRPATGSARLLTLLIP